MHPATVTLSGQHVTLAPLSHDHAADLRHAAAGMQGLWYTAIPAPDSVPDEIDRRLALQEVGTMLPFAALLPGGRAVGMTTYMNMDIPNRRLEIGATWYAGEVQRTGLNTEAKLMLLDHAFEKLGCIAVEFRTHAMNLQSRRAIERLGAKLDGILRSHMILANGTLRDTAVYSVVAHEWPAVRANLEYRLSKPPS